MLTRCKKLSYRKANRTMRPIYGCPENFPVSLTTPTATFPEILNGLLFRLIIEPINVRTKLDVCSFTSSRDNRGTHKKLGSLWICPRSLFSNIFNGLLFGWTLVRPNLKFVALPVPVPEIIGGTQRFFRVPEYVHAPFSPKFLMGFCSDGPRECAG